MNLFPGRNFLHRNLTDQKIYRLALIFLLRLMGSKLKIVILILVIFVIFYSHWAMNKKKGKQRNVYGKEDSTYHRNLKHSFQFQTRFCKCGGLLSGLIYFVPF